MLCASFSMLDGPGRPGCDVLVHGCWDSRDVIVAAVFDCVKECVRFVMHLHHFQCLTVPMELAAMFWFMVVGIAEMLLWLLCLIVSKSV